MAVDAPVGSVSCVVGAPLVPGSRSVSDSVEEMQVRFATPDVAVVTVPSKLSTTLRPIKHENERQIRTFVVVKRGVGG